jgi:P4 family phage/plasmid primase-like protien
MHLRTEYSKKAQEASMANQKAQTSIYEAQLKSATKVSEKLKDITFKNNIMKELKHLFYDPKFLEELDEKRHLICFNNGVYDLENGLFRNGTPEDKIFRTTHIDYLPYDKNNKIIEEVEKFISEVQPEPEMQNYILALFASCLCGDAPDEKFHIWTGSGGNGKSILVHLFELAMGDYAGILSISLLTNKKPPSNAATPELAKCKGVRFLVFQEPEDNDTIHVGHMKELTGNDKISARALYKEPVDFYPQWKLMLTCNSLPTISATDGGTWRRLRVVPFEMEFVDNPSKSYQKKIDRTIKKKLPLWAEAFMSILINASAHNGNFFLIVRSIFF